MPNETSLLGLEEIYADPTIQGVHGAGWDALGEAIVVSFEAVTPSGLVRQRLLSLKASAAQDLLEYLQQALADKDTEELPRQ